MADNVLGFIATIDVTNLKAGLSQVKDAISQAKQQFENSTASLDKWQKTSEGVGAKLEQLNTVLKAQEKSIEAYENEIKRVSEKEGDHSKQLEILQKKLQQAKNSYEKTKASIDTYSKTFETLKEKEREENSQNSKLNKALEEQKKKLKDLETQYKSAVIQNGKYSKEAKTIATEVKKATKELKSQEKQVESLEKDYKNLTTTSEKYSKIGKTLLKGLSSLAVGFTALVSGLVSASNSTEEFRENQARLKKVFEEAGLSVETLKNQYEKLYKVIGDDNNTSEALTYLSQFAKTEEELNDWTTVLIGTYAKFGKALPTQELAKNINEAIQTAEVTGQLADAIKQGGGSVDSFKNMLSILTNEQERESFILAYLKDDYADLAEAYGKNNKELIKSNEANLKYNESLARIGELGSSVKTAITNLKAQALEKLYPVIEKTINFVDNHFTLVASISGVLAGIGVALVSLTASVKAYNAIVKTAKAVQNAWNAVMSANPIGLIITAIAGLSVAIYALIKNWDKVKEVAEVCWNKIKEIWEPAAEFFKNLGNNITNFFKNAWGKIVGFFETAWTNIKKIWQNPGEFFKGVIDSIVKFFEELPQKFLEIGRRIGEKLKEGLTAAWDGIKTFFTGKSIEIPIDVKVADNSFKTEQEINDFTKNLEERAKKETSIQKTLMEQFQLTDEQWEELWQQYNANIEEITNHLNQTIKEKTEETQNIAETANETIESEQTESQKRKLSSLEEFWAEELSIISEGYNKEIQQAKTEQEKTDISKSYAGKIATIKEFYAEWEQQSGQTNEAIKNQIAELEEKFASSNKGASKTFKQTMQGVLQVANNVVSKISSLFSSITTILNDMWQQQMDNIDTEWEAYEEEYEKKKELAETENEEELERIEEQYENQLELLENQKEAELDENARAYREGLIDDKQYFANKYKIMAKYNNKEEDAALEKDKTVADSGRQLTDYLKQLEDEKLAKEQEMLRLKNEAARKQFEAQKANDIANVWIQAAVAILKAFADLGPIGGAIEMAVILALAGAQTAIIASKQFTPYTELAEGGIVDKPTHALIGEDGEEAVMPLKNNTEWIAELAEKLNELQNKDFTIDNTRQRQQIINNYETSNNYNYEQNITSPKSLTRREIYKDSRQLLSLKKY